MPWWGKVRQSVHDLDTLEAEVHQGTLREAILFSKGVNAQHGERRSNEDKRRAVESLLVDAEWQKRTSEWIADACHVSEVYVWKLKGGKNVNPNIRIEKSIPEEQAPNPESPKENGEKSTSSVKKSRKKEKERDTRRD